MLKLEVIYIGIGTKSRGWEYLSYGSKLLDRISICCLKYLKVLSLNKILFANASFHSDASSSSYCSCTSLWNFASLLLRVLATIKALARSTSGMSFPINFEALITTVSRLELAEAAIQFIRWSRGLWVISGNCLSSDTLSLRNFLRLIFCHHLHSGLDLYLIIVWLRGFMRCMYQLLLCKFQIQSTRRSCNRESSMSSQLILNSLFFCLLPRA